MSQSYATDDLETRSNFFRVGVADALKRLVANGAKTLELLDLGTMEMALPANSSVAEYVAKPDSLVVFILKGLYSKVDARVKMLVNLRLRPNIRRNYDVDIAAFDSVLALRGEKVLKKQWKDPMETVNQVMHANDPLAEAQIP